MGNADLFGDALGVINILPRAAGAFLLYRAGIKLQRDAHHVVTLALEQRRGDGGIHATRHGGDDAAFRF